MKSIYGLVFLMIFHCNIYCMSISSRGDASILQSSGQIRSYELDEVTCQICQEKLYNSNSRIRLFPCGNPIHGIHQQCYENYRRGIRNPSYKQIRCIVCRREDVAPKIENSMSQEQFKLNEKKSLKKRFCSSLALCLSCNGTFKDIGCFSLYWHDCYPKYYDNCNDFYLLNERGYRQRFYKQNTNSCFSYLTNPNPYYKGDGNFPDSEKYNLNRSIFENITGCCIDISKLFSDCYKYSFCIDRHSADCCDSSCYTPCSMICIPFCIFSCLNPLTWWGTAYKCSEDCSE